MQHVLPCHVNLSSISLALHEANMAKPNKYMYSKTKNSNTTLFQALRSHPQTCTCISNTGLDNFNAQSTREHHLAIALIFCFSLINWAALMVPAVLASAVLHLLVFQPNRSSLNLSSLRPVVLLVTGWTRSLHPRSQS